MRNERPRAASNRTSAPHSHGFRYGNGHFTCILPALRHVFDPFGRCEAPIHHSTPEAAHAKAFASTPHSANRYLYITLK